MEAAVLIPALLVVPWLFVLAYQAGAEYGLPTARELLDGLALGIVALTLAPLLFLLMSRLLFPAPAVQTGADIARWIEEGRQASIEESRSSAGGGDR